MARELPALSQSSFENEVKSLAPEELSPLCLENLYLYYQELRRWNPKLSLVGPAAKDEIFERHFGESLAGLELLKAGDRTLVDLGSGAGFPGLVLAIARPALQVFLIEAREKKWAFLEAVVRRCRLSAKTLNVRVAAPQPAPPSLPAEIDVVTCRAVAITHEFLSPFLGKMPPARFLLWQGREDPAGIPQLRQGREVVLAGRQRRIVEWLEQADQRPPLL
jgi:16S rRNA (guanine527-N7)-methyltransferase